MSYAFQKVNAASRQLTKEGRESPCYWLALIMLLEELQIQKRVDEESSNMAQHDSASAARSAASHGGYPKVKRKNRMDLKSRKINSEPQPLMRKLEEGGNAECQDFLLVLIR